MTSKLLPRRTWVALLALAATLMLVGGAGAVSGAGFTTTNDTVDVTVGDPGPHCLNGNPAINCNIYTGKQYVWLNGGPGPAQPEAGTYVFAVLAPGGQGGNQDPNDGTPKNLSDVSPTTNTGAGDDWTNRVFSIDELGQIRYLGTHDFFDNKIRLMPYDDTPNPGGVYIMAICNLADRDETAANQPGVAASACKYDAFKVRENPPPPGSVASCFSGMKYHDDNRNGQFDDGEAGLEGWLITLDPGTPGDSSDDLTATTDSDGNWSACESAHDPAEGTTSYTVSETLQDHWVQTGNTVEQSIPIGGALVSLNNFVYTVTVPNDAIASGDGLNFGNVEVPQVASCFSGTKYRDDNKNGQFEVGEVGLQGWVITLDPGTLADSSDDLSTSTDSDGNWSVCESKHDPAAGTKAYTVTETPKTGWKQAGNTVDQSVPLGGASVSLSNLVYKVTVPTDADASSSGLNFGNIPQGKVWGAKYYDTNLNGQYDAGEVLISNWRIKQDATSFPTGSAFTDGNGFAANFVRTLDPGTYAFSEVRASNWIQTGNTVNQTGPTGGASASLANKAYSVTIPNDQPSSVSKVYFGNVCLGAGGGLTLGFWSNKNGEAKMNDNGSNAPELALLVSGNLRNANGTNFDPANYNAFRNWLLSATATNMAYMLSAQLSAMELNVEAGFVNGGSMVFSQVLGFISINSLMALANTELGVHGLTVAASADRSYQEALKNALDAANNNLNFVQGSPATCAAPIFSAS